MARTALARELQKIYAITSNAAERRVDAARVADERRHSALTRREFLDRAGKAGLLALAGNAFFSGLVSAAADSRKARIAIVGGGLAGLACAYWLKQMGLDATIYESAPRVGGRCHSNRRAFDEDQITERGGELIDTGHKAVRFLAQRLGLTLDDLHAAERLGTEPFYYFDGSRYPFENATADFQKIVPQLRSDLHAAGYPTLYNSSTLRGQELDLLSVTDYINMIVPGGVTSRLGKMLKVAYVIEYGAEAEEQSALNLLYLLGYSARTRLEIFGESDERYRIRGGNDQMARGMAAGLEGQIEYDSRLTRVVRTPAGRFDLTFDSAQGARTVRAEKVVFALPFSILRASVDYAGAGFSALKQTAIQQLGMGTNSKLQLQFTKRFWRNLGNNGDSYADTGYQNTWESTRAQSGKSGILVDYTGGTIGTSFSEGTVDERARQFLMHIEPVLPGATARWNGKATLAYWTGNPHTLGSYSYWKAGQYTQFAGIEGAQEADCHFAGEHTSINYQGFMNGALETGKRAAREVYADLVGTQPG